MHSDTPEGQALWRTSSLLLYQAGDVQSLLQAGASKDEVKRSLNKAVELAAEALTVLELCPEREPDSLPQRAVVALPLQPDGLDEEAA